MFQSPFVYVLRTRRVTYAFARNGKIFLKNRSRKRPTYRPSAQHQLVVSIQFGHCQLSCDTCSGQRCTMRLQERIRLSLQGLCIGVSALRHAIRISICFTASVICGWDVASRTVLHHTPICGPNSTSQWFVNAVSARQVAQSSDKAQPYRIRV